MFLVFKRILSCERGKSHYECEDEKTWNVLLIIPFLDVSQKTKVRGPNGRLILAAFTRFANIYRGKSRYGLQIQVIPLL